MISRNRFCRGWVPAALLLAFVSGCAPSQGASRQHPARNKPAAAEPAPAAPPSTPAPKQSGGGSQAAPAATAPTIAPNSVPPGALERLRRQAIEREKRMELQDALMRWRFLLQLHPQDREAATRVAVLREQVKLLAETHYRRGVSLFRKKQREDALREFLLALSYDPDHGDALDYVRNRLKPPDWVYYTTVQGDTMKGVALKAYQDEQKDFLAAAYNNLARDAPLSPGTVLRLPILEPDLRRPSMNVAEVLEKAKGLLEQEQFDLAIAEADSVLVYDSSNAAARDILNAAYYRQAKALAAQNKPVEALAMFRNVEPGYQDARELVDTLQAGLKDQAEEHYKKGIQLFIDEKLDEAIAEWEETLRIDLDHPKAAQDLENARELRERLQQLR